MSKYIVITGGELFNKGAQAMTFTVISKMKKRYPNKELVLLSRRDFEREEEDKQKYNFKILPWNLAIKFYLLGNPYSLIGSLINKKKYYEFEDYFDELSYIIKNTIMLIDISGYSLSSQTIKKTVIGYVSNIMVGEKYGFPVWLFPQSFGPFEFKGIYKYINRLLIKKYFSYPKKIFVREIHGYNSLINYIGRKLNNVSVLSDIVLQSKSDYDITSIYKNENTKLSYEKIHPNSVAIVPNMRVIDCIGLYKTLELYETIISTLLNMKKNIYIIRHSVEDLDICKEIKKLFINEDKVKVIDKEYNCIELEKMIKQFDYIIGSRYHSIVHAFRNKIPAISIGWAVKYTELLAKFKQERFNFDIRNNINLRSISNAIIDLEKSYMKESKIISDILKKVQENDVFAIMEEDL